MLPRVDPKPINRFTTETTSAIEPIYLALCARTLLISPSLPLETLTFLQRSTEHSQVSVIEIQINRATDISLDLLRVTLLHLNQFVEDLAFALEHDLADTSD